MKLVTAATMREMDRRTIEEFKVPGIVLMENAALRVVEAIVERYGPLHGKRVLVVCGKGNNGGDGFAIARHVDARYGAEVSVYTTFYPDPQLNAESDAGSNLSMLHHFGVPIDPVKNVSMEERVAELREFDIIIDALFGTGFHGVIEGPAAEVISAINRVRLDARHRSVESPRVISVDVPSGVDADTGDVNAPAVEADLTVTFALAKPGLFNYPGTSNVGKLVIGDICMPRQVVEHAPAAAWVTEPADIANWLPARDNGRDANKGKFGHVLVFAGSTGFLGAAQLSGLAAARAGAGLVTLAVPDSILNAAMAAVNPAVMTRGLSSTASGSFAVAALDAALVACAKATSVAIGPGIGASDSETVEFVREFIRRCPVPLVVDADALNILAAELDHGVAIINARTTATVLTPHPGEMGRLLGRATAEVQSDRLGAVRQGTLMYRSAVLLKGARTLIAQPQRLVRKRQRLIELAQSYLAIARSVIQAEATSFPDDVRAATASAVHEIEPDLVSFDLDILNGALKRLIEAIAPALKHYAQQIGHSSPDSLTAIAPAILAEDLVADSSPISIYFNTTGNPGMATGGSGDVLTGVIAALLGMGLDELPAAAAGAYIHGLAGDLAAEAVGEAGLIATDIVDRLPHAIAKCNLGIR